MTKISKRLETIVSFINPEDTAVDVGCDHGLLSIYLTENKLVKKIIASDINQNALNSAINNIKARKLKIETILSDGLKNIDVKGINTIIISGMGTSTILHILSDSNKISKIDKLIIQSNNNHEELRRNLNCLGYHLEDEKYTFDKNKWYITCKFIKSNKTNDETTIKYGLLNNKKYNEYLLDSNKKIYKKIPITSIKQKIKHYIKINKIKKAISSKTK